MGFIRKEEWVVNEEDYRAEVVVDRDTDDKTFIKIEQDAESVWLTVEGARQLIGAITEAIVLVNA